MTPAETSTHRNTPGDSWSGHQSQRLTLARNLLLIGLAGLLIIAPWQGWSSAWPWYICAILAAAALLLIPWLGGTLNWRALARPWCWGLALFAAAVLISCLASHSPSVSWRFFRKEMLFYAITFLGITLGVPNRRDLSRLVMTIALGGLVATAAGVATYYHFLHGADEVTRLVWSDEKVVGQDVPGDLNHLRAQFPLRHHNKLGFFAALSTLLLVHLGVTRRRTRWLWVTAALVPLWALGLTLSRGAMAGLAVGALGAAVLSNWRCTLFLLVGGTALMGAISSTRVGLQIRSIVDPVTYTDPFSSMTFRRRGWTGAFKMIQDHPLTGVGYSWKNFKDLYPSYALPEEIENKVHAHNDWIEYAVEIGVLGALGLAVFQIGLLGASVRVWRRTRDPTLPFLVGLQLTILVAGMVDFYQRQTLGLIIWAVFGICVAWLGLIRDGERATP
jgi:putative inorganic carbon (HCO3(-)) transporter